MDKETSFKLLDAYFDLGVSYQHTNFRVTLRPISSGQFYRHRQSIVKSHFPSGAQHYFDAHFCLFYSQDGASEEFIGEWAEKRGIRDQLVIATKVRKLMPYFFRLTHIHIDRMRFRQYTANYKRSQDDITHQVNYTGNHTKSLHLSVHDSLKRLRTSYIDILYVHWWDYNTSVEEVMNSLHILVLQGKVLYLVCLFPYANIDLPF